MDGGPAAHVDIIVDDRPMRALPGESVRLVARRHGIAIPGLCDIEGIEPLESCLLCVVQVQGERHHRPSCSAVARPGMVVRPDTEAVQRSRRVAMELLFSDHFGECMAPCELACPAGWDVPGFMRALAAGQTAESAAAARSGLALPAVLGRICNAPCERACRRDEDDEALGIRELHRFASEAALPTAPPTGRRVAVIGAGPAGLAAASRLLEYGHGCTIYDSHARAGGSLCAVAEDELPAAELDAEVARILAAGAVFEPGRRVDGTRLDRLREDFDAVVVAVGTDGMAGLGAARGKRRRDEPTWTTPWPDVFAAGAAAGRAGLAIRVVASGLDTAKAVHHHLLGKPAPGRSLSVRYGKLDEAIRRTVFGDVAMRTEPAKPGPVDAGRAAAEAALCLQCGCRGSAVCGLRDQGAALGSSGRRVPGDMRLVARDDSHPAIVFEPHKCILCGACVAVDEAIGQGPGIAIQGRGFHARVAGPADMPLADALDEASALACADACPTRAMRRRAPFEG